MARRTAGIASDDFAVAVITNSVILPVTLLQFNATLLAMNKVGLTWTTSMEQGTSHFDIERSTDGITFSKIGQAIASDTATSEQTYSFTNAQALLTINYYRIKVVDRDSRATYSKTAIVKMNTWQQESALFPKPGYRCVAGSNRLKGNAEGNRS